MSHPFGIPPPNVQLPDETHVGVVRLQVSDLSHSLDYYTRVIGLRADARAADTVTLGPHGERRVLLELHTTSGVRPSRRGAIGLFHFAILLPDRAALGRFAKHLEDLRIEPAVADHLVSEALYLWDPDGLGIEVYVDRPRDTWRQNGRELVMATDPLDIANVMASGRGEPWDGMPAGTVIGHVHLHVGSLNEAEAFYHAALGLDKTVWHYPGALFLAAGGYHHHLGTNVWASGAPAKEDEARLIDWELVVPDASAGNAAAESVRAAGYSVEERDRTWIAADPWGTRVRITPRG